MKRKGFDPNISSRVCSDHFLRTDFVDKPKESYKLTLKNEAVPSLYMSGRYDPPKKMCNIETITHDRLLQSSSMTNTTDLNSTILISQESIETVSISDSSIISTAPNINLTPIKTPYSLDLSPLLKTPSKCIRHSSTVVTPTRRLNFIKSPSTPTNTKLKKKVKLLHQTVRRKR